MLEPLDVARLDEARQAAGVAAVSEHVRPVVGGGVACRGEPGSWNNAAIGLGMGERLPDDWGDELRSIVAWYASAGIEPRLDLVPFADPAILRHCEAESFCLRHFENVLYRQLRAGERVVAAGARPGIEVRLVDPGDDAEVRRYSEIAMSGFHPPGHVFAETDFALSSRIVKHPRTRSFIASVETESGVVDAGAGAIELHGETSCLFGLSTLPAFRRMGVQQTLIAARLNLAIEMGMRVSTISSRPGEGTERNVRRMGFQTAYTKAILVKPGPGLVPSQG